MKTIILALLIFCAFTVKAQNKTEKIAVSGNCGMCKTTIEKAAKKAGATKAMWNEEAKILTLTFDAKKTTMLKIEKAIAAKGYDTKNEKGNDAAYKKLPACCHYRDEE